MKIFVTAMDCEADAVVRNLANVRVKDLQKIADVLGMPVYELFPELASNPEMEGR